MNIIWFHVSGKSSFEGTVFINNAYVADEEEKDPDLDESRTYQSAVSTYNN
mgnify:CR=1 FL=1